MSVATVIVAVSGYLIIFLSARVLGPSLSGVFMVFWSGLYLAIGTVFGLQQETTRAVRTARSIGIRRGDTRPVSLAAFIVGCVIAIAVLLTSPLWSAIAFGDNAVLFTILIAIATLSYSGLAATAGALAGMGAWRNYSTVLIAETIVRLGLFGLILATSQSMAWLAIVSVAATACWVPLLLVRTYRDALLAPNDSPLGRSTAQMAQGAVAAASSALLITGFPLILSLTSSGEDPAILGIVILTVTITRGPILVPLNAFLGMLVGSFIDNTDRVLSRVLKPIGWLMLASAVLWVVAYFVGEFLFVFVFGPKYAIDGYFIATCIVGAALIGSMSIAGTAVLAQGKHLSYSAGWLIAAVVAVVVLSCPLPIESRVLVALVVGPLFGMFVHIATLRRNPTSIPKL